jgi:hypothetical protein
MKTEDLRLSHLYFTNPKTLESTFDTIELIDQKIDDNIVN